MTSIQLTPKERHALLDHYRQDADLEVRLRAHVLLLLDAGSPWARICAVLFCSASTISQWKRRFEKEGEGRLGAQAALTATAHKLARIVYQALRHGLTYVRRGQEEYEAQMKEKQLKALRRKARQFGLEVVEKASGSVPAATATPAQG